MRYDSRLKLKNGFWGKDLANSWSRRQLHRLKVSIMQHRLNGRRWRQEIRSFRPPQIISDDLARRHAPSVLIDLIGIFLGVQIEVRLGDELLCAEQWRQSRVFEDCSAHGKGVLRH